MQITNPKSQQERVIAVCSDGQYRTLDRIKKEIWLRYGKYDTTPAISARLRESGVLFRYGFAKEKCRIFNPKTEKFCHYYTLKRVTHE